MHICKGWKLTQCKFITWLFTSVQKCVFLCMQSSYPCATYVWFWSFMLALITLEQYLQQYFKKWGNGVKFRWWEFRWVGHQSGGLERYLSCPPWNIQGNILWSVRLSFCICFKKLFFWDFLIRYCIETVFRGFTFYDFY